MKVQLKKVKFFEGHDTMTGFNADVWIKGVKCMHVHDSAHGGCFEYYNHSNEEKVKNLIEEFNDHIDQLPKTEFNLGGKKTMLKYNMDMFINDLLEKQEKDKQKKKMDKLMKTAIVIGVPNDAKYAYFNFKKDLKTVPLPILQKNINNIKVKHLTEGKVILNTNLKELGVVV